ncbi:radical SAM family heme chaperone HemW [Myroides sp. LJL116]
MAGIYIHIPFCKQACHYCDFHFSTSLKNNQGMLDAIAKEMQIRASSLQGKIIDTIYFGGGTPSILEVEQINTLIDKVHALFEVNPNAEITLEANPDDLDLATIIKLADSKVNRLSIGVQSFDQKDLEMMNRAHNQGQAIESLENASKYFDNISVDLIYGIPGLSNDRWRENIQRVVDLGIKHISCYALTVEPRTALNKLIQKGVIPMPEEDQAHEHFVILMDTLKKMGYQHYELSNFSMPGYHSKNNTAYWLGKVYLGLGPSAHSFDGESRSWNIANNNLYIKGVESSELRFEKEHLSLADRYNEYIMTGLRTIWGVDTLRIAEDFGKTFQDYVLQGAQKHINSGLMHLENGVLTITDQGKFLSDGLASDLFWTK